MYLLTGGDDSLIQLTASVVPHTLRLYEDRAWIAFAFRWNEKMQKLAPNLTSEYLAERVHLQIHVFAKKHGTTPNDRWENMTDILEVFSKISFDP